ncbi:hypothetical protein [Rhodopila sp.]|uniref:hypothetical protein n=1 Tax=Rhodopila sp. TaxID=2480087 RepID=UPI003D14CA3A
MRLKRGMVLLVCACLYGVQAQAQLIEYYHTPEEAVAAGVARDFKSAFLNLRAAALSKQELQGEIANARNAFLDGCAEGVRDPRAEADFAAALQKKDFYYLPFYVTGGSVQSLPMVMDRATGGAVDGGIPRSAAFSFQAWANAISEMLRGVGSNDTEAIGAAAERSKLLYAQYVSFRNEAEIEYWRKNRKLFGRASENDPEGLADTYVRVDLVPQITFLYGGEPDKLAALKTWSEQVRAAIIAYEKAQPTVDSAVRIMQGANYPPDIIQAFTDEVNKASQNGRTNQAVLVQAYARALMANDKRKDPNQKHPRVPDMTGLQSELKDKADPQAADQVNRLVRADPYPVPYDSYTFARFHMVHGDFYVSAPPILPGADWCTGHLPAGAQSPSVASDRAAAAQVAEQAAAARAIRAQLERRVAERKAAEQKARDDAANAMAGVTTARAAVASALAGVAYGPDINGLRLGMPAAQADEVVRRQMQVGAVVEATSLTVPYLTKGLGRVRIFISKNRTEQVTLLLHEAKTGPVVGIRREALTDSTVTDATLKEKYGPPQLITPVGHWSWGVESSPCVLQNDALDNLKMLEGTSSPFGPQMVLRRTMSGFGMIAPLPGSAPAAISNWSKCGALLQINRYHGELEESLYDARIFGIDLADAQAMGSQTASAPKP